MNESTRANGGRPDPGRAAEQSIEEQIRDLRGDLTDIVSELDRRRHEAFDLRLQVRRHARALEIVGATVAFGVAALVAWRYSRNHRDTPVAHVQNLGRALTAVAKNPDRLLDLMDNRPDARAAVYKALAAIAGTAGKRAIARL